MNKLKVFLIAGEASGDLLGSKLIAAIKKQIGNKEIEIIGIGGPKMEEQGLKSIFPISELSLMGFAEIIPHIPKLLKLISKTAELIVKEQPDLLITIDAPDFCFRVVEKIKKYQEAEKIKKIHMIAPSVWAYRENRAQKISKLYDLLLAILPFEPPYFEKHGLKTVFIGHPIVEEEINIDGLKFKVRHKVSDDDILICLTPGSRISEVKKIFPQMIKAINILALKYHNIKVAIPLIEKTKKLVEAEINNLNVEVILVNQSEKYEVFSASNFAIAKSGTNTIEIAMASLPMIVVYKANILSYLIIKILAKIKFANLINLILNREVIPEMIQFNCRSDLIAAKLDNFIKHPELAKKQIEESKTALKIMGMGAAKKSSDKAAEEIMKLVA